MKKTNWTNDEIEFLQNNYDAMTQNELAEKLGRTHTAVQIKSKKLGLTRRQKFDKRYFQKIDTEHKAYWLGFIAADGYITHSCSYTIGIELRKSDADHLRKFNKDLDGNIPIEYHNKEHLLDGRKICADIAIIRLYSKEMQNDLVAHNVTPRKTHTLEFPLCVPDDYFFTQLRGYFDGNGSISLKNVKNKVYVRATISSGSHKFVSRLREVLYAKYNLTSYITADGNAYKLEIGGGENTKNFLNLIYKNSTIHLTRKYKRQETYSIQYM